MKVHWLDVKKGWFLYSAPDHSQLVGKFLYWNLPEGEIILASSKEVFTHKSLYRYAGFQKLAPAENPVGAGDAENGNIAGWESKGFNISTPENLRPKIAEVLGLQL